MTRVSSERIIVKAAIECDLAAVQRMIEADPSLINARDEDGSTLLHEAAMFGGVDLVAWLLDKGLDVNAKEDDGNTPLMDAVLLPVPAMKGTMESTVRLLLRRGADINAVNKAGNTALWIAEHMLVGTHKEFADLFPPEVWVRWRAAIKILREHGAKGSTKQAGRASLGCGIMALVVVAIGVIAIVA
jgi:hypothetical protein